MDQYRYLKIIADYVIKLDPDVVKDVHRKRQYWDEAGKPRFGNNLPRYVLYKACMNYMLTVCRQMMSTVSPYNLNHLVMQALRDTTQKLDPVGPVVDLVTRVSSTGGTDPWEGASKRAGFALFNHYYTIQENLLVSGEQERWRLVQGMTKKGKETGPLKPDILVQSYDQSLRSFSDLIFCEVKRSSEDEYQQVLDQLSEAAGQHFTNECNEHVFACYIHGSKVSFFKHYGVDAFGVGYKNLQPIADKIYKPEAMAECWRWSDKEELIGFEVDMLDPKWYRFVHQSFLEMSCKSGPIDPIDLDRLGQ